MPCRLRDLKRALEALGIAVQAGDGTSHWRAIGAAGKTYIIPAHNGLKTEIGDHYIRGVCRSLGLDEKKLRVHL